MMLRILKKKDFPQVYALLEESFPPEEYRPYEDQLALMDREEYIIYGERDPRGELWALMAVWEFPEFLFLEHFAVKASERNKGFGAGLLRALQERYSVPLCLEVEPPEGELSRRRIGFYERNGFFLNPYAYAQPSLGEGRKAVPLKLMTTGAPLTPEAFRSLKEKLYAQVYGLTLQSLTGEE